MSWAHYLLQVNIYLLVFYGFYKLLLDKETYFTLNRIYLVAAALLSLAIPYLRFEWFTKQEAIQPVYISVEQIMGQPGIVEAAPDGLSTGNLIAWIYLTGILFFGMRLILRLLSLNQTLKQEEKGSAFSFFRKKRIDPGLPQLNTIHKHEDTHISQWHSADVLFFELLSVFTWFNPIIYFYKSAAKSIHEYLADEEAAKFQGDKEQYALLLLSSAFGIPVHTITNNFFTKSLIKKRIYMLHKPRSPKTAILKYGLFIPLFAIALIFSSATIRNNEELRQLADYVPLDEPAAVVADIVKETIPHAKKARPETRITQYVKGKANQVPEWQPFYSYMRSRLTYPADAQKKQLQGSMMIRFSIMNGVAENAEVVAGLGGDCDKQVMQKIMAYTKFNKVKNGNYTLKVNYVMEGAKTVQKNKILPPVKGYTALDPLTITTQVTPEAPYGDVVIGDNNNGPADQNKVFDFVSIDKQPNFPGGMRKFYEYLSQNLNYPKEALDKNVQGNVFLSFIIEKDGGLTNVKVERKLGSGTDEEALRLLNESPKWVPGSQQGNPVRVKYHFPIRFKLNKASDSPTNTPGPSSSNVIGLRFSDDRSGTMKFGDRPENDPLVILDGKTVTMAEMKAMSPDKIESINILKDAQATSIYGAKGANGVIIIKSKSKPASEVPEKPKK